VDRRGVRDGDVEEACELEDGAGDAVELSGEDARR
jgi:hypothetical protein